MADGLVLVATGLVCLIVFVAIVVREDRAHGGVTSAGWDGWLVLGLGVACIVGGVLTLAVPVFSG